MKFCDKCGALMLPVREEENKKTKLFRCRECGHEQRVRKAPEYRIEHRIEHGPREKIVVVEEDKTIKREMTEDEKRERRKQIYEHFEAES